MLPQTVNTETKLNNRLVPCTVCNGERGLTCSVVLLLFFKKSTNRGTIPAWMTSSMGGFGSFDSSLRNFWIAFSWSSSELLYKSAIISLLIMAEHGESMFTSYSKIQKIRIISISPSIRCICIYATCDHSPWWYFQFRCPSLENYRHFFVW